MATIPIGREAFELELSRLINSREEDVQIIDILTEMVERYELDIYDVRDWLPTSILDDMTKELHDNHIYVKGYKPPLNLFG